MIVKKLLRAGMNEPERSQEDRSPKTSVMWTRQVDSAKISLTKNGWRYSGGKQAERRNTWAFFL